MLCSAAGAGAPTYRGVAQFHPEENLSVPLSPVDVGREELHGRCEISAAFTPPSNGKLFQLKPQSLHQRSSQPPKYPLCLPADEENTSGR